MALIDEWMPVYDEVTRHWIELDAPPQSVWRALRETDFTSHPVTRLLLGLRVLPSLLVSPRTTIERVRSARASRAVGLDAVLRTEFVLLEERAPKEIVIGVTGRFWSPVGNLSPSDPATFRDPVPEGFARATWAFELSSQGKRTTLATETRIVCGGARARRRFRLYWLIVRPFSGLIRTLILGRIRRQLEVARS
jgi:hypothetical protein